MWAMFCVMLSAAQKNSTTSQAVAIWRVNAVEGSALAAASKIASQLDAMERDTLCAFEK